MSEGVGRGRQILKVNLLLSSTSQNISKDFFRPDIRNCLCEALYRCQECPIWTFNIECAACCGGFEASYSVCVWITSAQSLDAIFSRSLSVSLSFSPVPFLCNYYGHPLKKKEQSVNVRRLSILSGCATTHILQLTTGDFAAIYLNHPRP